MIKKLYCAVILLLLINTVTGQSFTDGVFMFNTKLTGRFNFTGLVDVYDQNISFGAEYRFDNQWSTGSDIAYIFHSVYLSENKSARGIILRPFIRYYPKETGSGFLEAEIHYKTVAYHLTDWLGRDVSNGIPAYEEFTSFKYIKTVYGLSIKAGTQRNLNRSGSLRLETYAGLGFRFKKQGVKNGTYIRERGAFPGLYGPEYFTAVVPVGFRLLYDIK